MIGKTHFEIEQTAVSIVCDTAFLGSVKNAIYDARQIIEEKIFDDSFFAITFEPYVPDKRDHPLIQRMCEASVLANVGPMASVAGAVSEYAVNKAVEGGCRHIIVENGGDIAMYTSNDTVLGIYSGDDRFRNTGLTIPATGKVTGICSSSGKIGPSVSFGNSGICTVFSDNVILADACATALGNMVRTGTSEEMSDSCEFICSVEGVDGCMCVANGLVAMCGSVPRLTSAVFEDSDITSVRF